MAENFTIRTFEPRDESSVIQLWDRVFPNDPVWSKSAEVISRKQTVQGDLFFVCISDNQLAGTVLAGFDGVRGWVHKLAVHPDFQRRGIASRLMSAAESGLSKMGCPKINLQVRSSNAEVIRFYKRAGYSVEDRVSMGKKL